MTEPGEASDERGSDAGPAAGPREPWRTATITVITPLTPRVVSVKLTPSSWRPFLAGQHIELRLTAEDGYHAQRSYSVASPPADRGSLELVVERLHDGEVSPYFHDAAAPGDHVEVRGPFAEHFVWHPGHPGPILLVAAGSGVAPFLSMVRQRAYELRANEPHVPTVLLVYSARDWADVILRDELLAHEQAQPGLQVVFCLTRDDARRDSDFSRRIDRAVLASVLARLPGPPALSYICGANRFVGDVANLLQDAGIPFTTIRTERYGGP